MSTWRLEKIVLGLVLLAFVLLVILAIAAAIDAARRRREREDHRARLEGIIRRYEQRCSQRWDDDA